MVDPLIYVSFQPVLHDWCTKGRGMCYPVCGLVHIKEPLLLIKKSSPCGDCGFPLSWCDESSDLSLMVDPLSYVSFQPVLHDWCSKGRGMCYPFCGVVHIKEPLLLIGNSSPCGDSGSPLPYVRRHITVKKQICLTRR